MKKEIALVIAVLGLLVWSTAHAAERWNESNRLATWYTVDHRLLCTVERVSYGVEFCTYTKGKVCRTAKEWEPSMWCGE